MMKRLIALLLACLLVVPCAFASSVSSVDTMIYGHNLYSDLTGAEELKGTPKTTTKGETSLCYFDVNGVRVGFILKSGKATSFYCIANEENVGEFLSQATSGLYNICGTDSLSYWYVNLFDQFLTARAGRESELNPFIENVCMFNITKKGSEYTFLATILK